MKTSTSLLEPRPGILEITPYKGGKSKLNGHDKVIRLASNESALGPSPKAIMAFEEHFSKELLESQGRKESVILKFDESLHVGNLANLGFDSYFKMFIDLFNSERLPNSILLTGPKGLGKATFAYHLINYFLSKNEKYSYDVNNFTINENNLTFKNINNSIHHNFFCQSIFKN